MFMCSFILVRRSIRCYCISNFPHNIWVQKAIIQSNRAILCLYALCHTSHSLNPSYTKLFRTHTLYQGGIRTPPPPPTISSTFSCTNVKFCKVLEIPFKVSENKKLAKNLLYGYHGNCLITWCFLLIIVKMIMKNR